MSSWLESTYGDRHRPPRSLDRFADAIRRTIARSGTALIPAFAVNRTPVLLVALRDLMAAGRVPRVPVFVDSPMALAAFDVDRRAMRAGTADIRRQPGEDDPFDPGSLHVARTVPESA